MGRRPADSFFYALLRLNARIPNAIEPSGIFTRFVAAWAMSEKALPVSLSIPNNNRHWITRKCQAPIPDWMGSKNASVATPKVNTAAEKDKAAVAGSAKKRE